MSSAISAFYIISGVMCLLGLQTAFLAYKNISRRLLGWAAVLCFCSGLYAFFTALYYAALNETASISALHCQTFFLMLCIPATAGVISCYTNDPHSRISVGVAFSSAFFVILLDWLSPVSVRFDSYAQWLQFHTIWGGDVSELHGETGWGLWFSFILGFALMGWGVWRASTQLRSNPRRFWLLIIYLLVQLSLITYSIVMQIADKHFIRLVGFSFPILSLMLVVTISSEFRSLMYSLGAEKKKLSLQKSISDRLQVDEARLSQVVEQSPSSVHVLDRKGVVLQHNLSSSLMWHSRVSNGDNLLESAPWKLLGIRQFFDRALAGETITSQLLEVKNKDSVEGLARWIRIKLFPVTLDGVIDGVTMVSDDVTRQYTVDRALKVLAADTQVGVGFFTAMSQQLASVLSAHWVCIAQFNKQKSLADSSFTTLAICEHGKLKENCSANTKGTFAELGTQAKSCLIDTGALTKFPNDAILHRQKADSLFVIPLLADDRIPIGFIAVLNQTPLQVIEELTSLVDILAYRTSAELQRHKAEQRIRRLAYEDYVTKLPNRAVLHEHLKQTIRECQLNNCRAVAYFLDLDHFKTINEALGHDIGDEVLRMSANRLKTIAGGNGFLSRFGGDEFVLIEQYDPVENIEPALMKRAEAIIEQLSKPLELGDRIISMGASVGVVLIPEHAASALDVMRRADSAIFKAKQEGRSRAEMYTPNMQISVDERLAVEKGLRLALDNNQLDIYYQPKFGVDLELVGAEALVRWQHPERGFISPAVFIPVAEETGLIHIIGDWIIERIARDISEWQAAGMSLNGEVAVNISAWQFARPDFEEKLLASIDKFEVDVKHIALEVTESAILRDIAATKLKLERIRASGIKVYLDDFGTGYSSLAYLKDLPLDAFKIDRAFVEDMESSQTAALVNSMVAIGRHMALDVVAEGVETVEQFETLKQMGCKMFQGYLYAKPMPEVEFIQWLIEGGAQ